MLPSFVDTSRPTLLYGVGLALLMLVSLLVSNIPSLAVSAHLYIPHRREICAALFALGALLGVVALQRHISRLKTPWKVPQSQVCIPYLLFFVLTLAAIALAR
jgi:hypothetical protein